MLKQILAAVHVKVLAAGAAGALATAIISAFAAHGHPLGTDAAAMVTAIAAAVAGYLKSSPSDAPQGVDVEAIKGINQAVQGLAK